MLKYYLILKPLAILLRLLSRLLIPTAHPTPTETIHIPSRDPKRTITANLYHPLSSTNNAQKTTPIKGKKPVLLNFCGSGFVLPGHGTDDEYCHYIAQNTDHVVLDVKYRLAPEYPCPAALEDAEDVLAWVRGQSELDGERVSVSGFSAGGNLATALVANSTSMSTSTSTFGSGSGSGSGSGGGGGFENLVSFYPLLDASLKSKQRVAPEKDGFKLPGWFQWFCTTAYTSGGVECTDPRVSPGFADLRWGVKRCLFVTAGRDCLAREVEDLADRLKRVRGGVECRRVEGVGHAWDKVVKKGSYGWEEKMACYSAVVDLIS
ncbi:Alpha/Beta hydrolase protein [Aspergillus avenaceus]|uniref:Alpha/Beta hydrolase protein n=1 Tax=Aspergillus avenaceus TaxID=36643 RepID=A0A5N6TNW1_ASPAV|nr:Alpha/Beta hydrolase protein [Aspergillus avenaceus]